jgi:sodium-dependent dicarboxylate transporter 2/3/5
VTGHPDEDAPRNRAIIRWSGLIAGPVAAVLLYALVPDRTLTPTGDETPIVFGPAGRATLGLMAWMAVWWLTEAIDVSATALLPVAILPLVTIETHESARHAVTAAAAPYANRFIALFMGGFMLALSMERWGLHRRIALTTLRFVGTRPMHLVAGFMAITATLSMWVSNTATAVMMLPIALSVHGLLKERGAAEGAADAGSRNLALCLMLGIAYAASIGGIGTLIGTPPNVIFAGFVERELGISISFARWLAVGVPLVVVFVPIAWFVLTRVVYPIGDAPIPGGSDLIRRGLAGLGPMKPGGGVTLVVFSVTAAAWISRPLLASLEIAGARPFAGLTDAGIAMLAALVLFVIPVDLSKPTFTMDWPTARRLPWGILILFGGGLSLAAAVTRHGVADFLGEQTRVLAATPELLVVVAVAAGVIFLTELTSNTATTAALLPILAGVAPALGLHPITLLVPAAIAASCAFMMPVATPPNAIVFGSGHVTIPQMCRAGLWLNLIGIALVTALTYAVALPVLGIGVDGAPMP